MNVEDRFGRLVVAFGYLMLVEFDPAVDPQVWKADFSSED